MDKSFVPSTPTNSEVPEPITIPRQQNAKNSFGSNPSFCDSQLPHPTQLSNLSCSTYDTVPDPFRLSVISEIERPTVSYADVGETKSKTITATLRNSFVGVKGSIEDSMTKSFAVHPVELAVARVVVGAMNYKNERSKSIESQRSIQLTEEKPTVWERIQEYFGLFLIWLSNPLNIIVAILGLAVVVSGAILVFVLAGIVKCRDEDTKTNVIEINSQILNAIFFLDAIVMHPRRIRWIFYYKNRSPRLIQIFPLVQFKPGMVKFIIVLLNINCVATYVVAATMWAWGPRNRPPWMIPVFQPIAFLTGCIGGILFNWQRKKAKILQQKEMDALENIENDLTVT